uniref:Uncharacterized protein MANES_10G087100 n=1 Tax=Rhizophora mucronata TaxID=61149 RepID=A0A2P2K490_RHIMU
MSFTVTISSPSPSPSPSHTQHRHDHQRKLQSFTSKPEFGVHFHSLKSARPRFLHLLQVSRRTSSFPPESNDLVDDNPRNWSRSKEFLPGDDEDDDGDDDEEEDRSFDLLVRFVQNVFKKISKRARKAARSVLPAAISTKLVGFSVNGVLVLAFLWVLKAFLEVTTCLLNSLLCIIVHVNCICN